MDNDVIKEWTELPPRSEMPTRDDDEYTNWTVARGGMGLPNTEWHLDYIQSDCSRVVYRLPPMISEMIDLSNEWGQDEIRRKLRQLIGAR